MKPSELLSSPDKWNKGGGVCGSYCIIQAIALGMNTCNFVYLERRRKLATYLGFDPNCDLAYMFDWNDAPERTFEEVRAALIACDL